MAEPEEVLSFWFGEDLDSAAALEARSSRWFAPDAGFDARIRERFADLPGQARDGTLEHWRDTPRPTLALVLALDQFPRNLYRESPQAYAFDSDGVRVALTAIEQGFDRELHAVEAVFLYLPLEHSEDREMQERCVELFRALMGRAPVELRKPFQGYLDYALRHQRVIEQFGRFPHRNALLGRAASREEEDFLASGGDSF